MHVYTHAGDDPQKESNAGKFSNRGGYKSVFKRFFSHDEFVDNILLIDVPPGPESFELETLVTGHFSCMFPHAREANFTTDRVAMINMPHAKGRQFPETRVYVSLGQGLRECLIAGSIIIQAAGPVKSTVALTVDCAFS